jgi:hypothetical protein
MDSATEERIVAIIDRAITDVASSRPAASEVVDVLLDLRLRVLELAVFDWIESDGGVASDGDHPKRTGFVGLTRRQP